MQPPPPPGDGAASRLLLLEDEELVASLVRFAIEDLSIDLVECPRVADAERELGLRPCDILVADLTLPGESGLSFLRRLRQVPGWRAELRIITFSGGLTGAVRRELQALGVQHMLSKPASVAQLRACIVGAAIGEPAADAPPIAVPSEFADEVQAGRAAVALLDLQGLRAVARRLRPRLEGIEPAASLASALELAARLEEPQRASQLWATLAEQLCDAR
jgi:CheY-like chemotaxis protein